MSEVAMNLLPPDEGEPPSSKRVYRENHETGESYDPRFSEYMAVQSLTGAAEAILEEKGTVRVDGETVMAQSGSARLLRTSLEGVADLSVPVGYEEEVPDNQAAYGYTFWTNENDCRTWTDASEYLSWCVHEQRHEPAAEVEKRLRDAFDFTDEPSLDFGQNRLQRLGGWLIARFGK